MTRDERFAHEQRVAARVAEQLYGVLPTDDASTQALIDSGHDLALSMSWEVVAREHVLPALDAIARNLPRLHIA
jgi:hypothetical protein